MAYITSEEMYMGETAEIVSICGDDPESRRLRDMGLREGKLIDLLFHDPAISRKTMLGVDNNRIAFDSRFAGQIRVRPIKSYFETVRTQANFDALTGCLNRHAANHILRDELEKFALKKIPLTLLMADLDHFKRINDTHGHAAGDAVLRHFAAIVRQALRRSDALCRWGGEEFLILLRGTLVGEAVRIAERIRESVEGCIFPHFEGNGLVTVSIGGAGLPPHRDAQRLMADADEALYRAKNGGRNRVTIWR